MRYDINTKKLFLTYPQCSIPLADVLTNLNAIVTSGDPIFGGSSTTIVHYAIAHELHANGDHHRHVYLELANALRSKHPACYDLTYNGVVYHGNYQGARSPKNVVKYCTKDEAYIANFDVASMCDKRSSRSVIAEDLVIKKRKLEDVLKDYPTLVFEYSKLRANMKLIDLDLQEIEPLPDKLDNPWNLDLTTNRQSKLRHYWIWSRQPNQGKTYNFGLPLSRRAGTTLATSFQYWTVNRRTNLILLDDFNLEPKELPYNAINQLADGTFDFRIFMGGYLKLDSFLVIILSNCPIEEVYKTGVNLIRERFIEYNVDPISSDDFILQNHY